jgi:spermidine synthase
MLMSSHVTDSEEALADVALEEAYNVEEVLVGGLGLGFTLRAVLDRVPDDAVVTVAELLPTLVEWNRSYVGALSDHPLEDPRCELVVENVLDTIKRSSGRFDAIILDVDNGPVALANVDNQKLYGTAGLRACHDALVPGGVLAVWSAGSNPPFERRLKQLQFDTEVVKVRATRGSAARHVLFIARRG